MIHNGIMIIEFIMIFMIIVFSLYKYQMFYQCKSPNNLKKHMLKIYGTIIVTSGIYLIAQIRWFFFEIQYIVPTIDNILWYFFDFSWMIMIIQVLRIRVRRHDNIQD